MGRIRAPIFRPNWSHPLNRGRVAWWLCQPNKLGGGTWFDLCANNHGTLVSMDGTSGPTNGFRPATRPGSWGSVLFGGGYVSLGFSPNIPCTLRCWFRPNIATGNQRLINFRNPSSGVINLGVGVSNLTTDIYAADGTSTSTTGSSVPNNTWSCIHGVFSGPTSRTLYVNGVQVASSTVSRSPSGITLGEIGGFFTTGLLRTFSGNIDDGSVWSRDLTAAEVQLDYTLSRQRYPGVLQSMPLRTYSVPAVGPVGNGLLMRRRRFLLGAA